MVTKRDRKTGRFATTNGSVSIKGLGAMLLNAMTSRSRLSRGVNSITDPRRDVYDEAGYPQPITKENYRDMYDRESIAARVVEILPKESWKVQPRVFETEDPEDVTQFEQDWADLAKQLRGESWYQDEEGNPIWEFLLRTDISSGIGHFGLLLFGLSDGKELREPVEPNKGMELTFIQTFSEDLVEISRYDQDVKSPRFGQPTSYKITFNHPEQDVVSGVGQPQTSMDVHWTRVLHVAEKLIDSEFIAIPRMKQAYNRLYDLVKLYGGSAEMYWRGALPPTSWETHPQLGGDVVLPESLKDEIEQLRNGLQRDLVTTGLTANSLAPQVVDPTPQIDAAITAICILEGIPKRVFMGSERGELASGQDSDTWNTRLRSRQTNYLTPRVIVTFVDRLIMYGVLTEPEGYSVVWPDLETASDAEQADVAVKRTDAMSKYVSAGVQTLMEPVDFFHRVLGFTEEEAIAIVENATDQEDSSLPGGETLDEEMKRRVDEATQMSKIPQPNQEKA